MNNAGIEFGGPFAGTTEAELEAIVTVNLLAVMDLTRLMLPGMHERRRGHVVNIASLAGKAPSPYLASYSATKHGVVGFTHALRAEHGPEPVGFTAICPVFISRVGMYGRIEDRIEGPNPIGTLPPERVGEAVVRALRRNPAEVIVGGPAGPAADLALPACSRGRRPGWRATAESLRVRGALREGSRPAVARVRRRRRNSTAVLLQSVDRRKEVVLT